MTEEKKRAREREREKV